MTDYQNSGILFTNDKRGNERAPDYTGNLNVGGTDYRLAAWVKKGKKGKFITIKVSDIEPPITTEDGRDDPDTPDDLDDEIPF